MGRTTSYSTLNITAVMMTAPRLAFGMYAQNGMSRARAIITRDPVQIPPPGVLTPLAQFTAVLENDPVVGIDWTNDPTRLQIPSAIISWFASTGFPPATNITGSKSYLDNIIKHFNQGEIIILINNFIRSLFYFALYLPKAFAMATFSKITNRGRIMIADPKFDSMPEKGV